MKLKFYIISFISLALLACKGGEFSGPELLPPTDDFSFVDSLKAESASVDFITDSVGFSAKFSENVSWKLSINGDLSGAVKNFTGSDSVLSVIWDGRSDNVFLFREGESTSAILSFVGSDATDTVNVTVDSPIKFGGLLVADYEGNGIAGESNWWNTFNSGEFIFYSDRFQGIPVPQGASCLKLKGLDLEPDGFLGLTGHNGAINYADGVDFPEDNDQLFFNFYLSGTRGTRVETRLMQTLINGPTNGLEGTQFSHFVNISWDGWRLLSVPYSEFIKTESDDAIPFKVAREITRVKFALRAASTGSEAEAYIDYPIFTFGKPFTP